MIPASGSSWAGEVASATAVAVEIGRGQEEGRILVRDRRIAEARNFDAIVTRGDFFCW